ncbi:MAG: FecR domain-containing protein [Fidelibacterota bacterium]
MFSHSCLVAKVHRLLLFLLLAVSGLMGVDKVALTMKTTGDVRHKPVQVPDYESLRRGTALFDGELVVTGDDGLAIALFLDDKSQLKIKKNSEVEISGVREKGAIAKRVGVSYGTLKASVKKQTRDFVITTPTSVASIKGTEFWLISDPDSGDVLISIFGAIQLTNILSGAVHSVEPGTVVASTLDGEINVLVTVKVMGQASSGVSGGRFSVTGLRVVDGDVAAQDLSGTIEVSSSTVIEGADVDVGTMVTITGTFDEQTGNLVATVVEVSAPITVEGIVSSPVVGNVFAISEVLLVTGDVEELPGEVKITEQTVIEGGEVAPGAGVTVTGNYNEETGVIEANRIVVVMPELRVTARVAAITSDREFEVSGIVVVAGRLEAASLSGKVIITESTVVEGGDLAVGAKVTITGTVDEATGDVIAEHIMVFQVVLVGVVSSPVVNEQFEISDVSVLEGDVDPSTLSGAVRLTPETVVEGGEITTGLQVNVTGNVEEGTGIFIATKIVIIVSERELIIDMEDNQGRRRELVIKFQ